MSPAAQYVLLPAAEHSWIKYVRSTQRDLEEVSEKREVEHKVPDPKYSITLSIRKYR